MLEYFLQFYSTVRTLNEKSWSGNNLPDDLKEIYIK